MTPKPSLIKWLDQHGAQLDAALLDIDGVLLNGKRRLPGSRRLLERLYQGDTPFLMLTNDGNRSPTEKADRMIGAGLTVTPDQIVSCGHAIAPLVRNMKIAGASFFVMGNTGVPCYAEEAGLVVTRDLNKLQECSGVIIGENNYDWQPVMNAVVNYFIEHPEAPLIVPNPDAFYPGQQLKIHIAAGGVGRFMKNILRSYGITIKPIYLGKPHAPIFRLAQDKLEQRSKRTMVPQKILMVGDNIAADIAGGLASGYTTALLLTGVTPLSAAHHHEIIPDMVFNTL